MENHVNQYGTYILILPFAILALAIVATAGQHLTLNPPLSVPGGDPQQGTVLIQRYGCGSCHTIQGAPGADGRVGPPLVNMLGRSFIAGKVQNTPENLVHWIQHPQEITPGTAMPDLGVTETEARDIAAYLYSIR